MSPRPTVLPSRHLQAGFTLVELLVVMGVIAILVAILLPAMGKAREQARELVCQSNQRQIGTAFLAFAADHQGRLPGNWYDANQPDKQHRAWLRNAGEPVTNAPRHGTVWKYLNNEDVYRCPTAEMVGARTSAGSNGRFDYSATLVFSGARVSDLTRSNCRFTYPDGRIDETMPPMLICEEDANHINGANDEGGHCNTDQLTHIHRGGSYFAAVDGSVQYFREPLNASFLNWSMISPSGKWVSMGQDLNQKWGWWDTQ